MGCYFLGNLRIWYYFQRRP